MVTSGFRVTMAHRWAGKLRFVGDTLWFCGPHALAYRSGGDPSKKKVHKVVKKKRKR
jgi:hypothetical protein